MFIKYLDDTSFKYLMRSQKSFHAEINSTNQNDFYVKIHDHNVRVIKLFVSTGETETFITNLGRKAFRTVKFEVFYHLRRGIATKYNSLKNKLDIESFSGKTLSMVQQDFYAAMYLSNILAVVTVESDEGYRNDNAAKDLKHAYRANENILMGNLKGKFVMILLTEEAAAEVYF